MRWVDALKEWNKSSPTWCIPRKGTKAYDEVKAIMAGNKIEASAEPKAEAKPMAQGIDMREVQRKRKQKAKLEELKQSAKDTVASALASIPAAAPKKDMMPSMMASIADIAKKAQVAKEKAWVPKTRDGKVYKRTIGGVVYLSDYLNQLWLKDPDGSVGDWVGVYLPGENRIDTTASDPYEEPVAVPPVVAEKQNTSKTELEEELDVGFSRPQSRSVDEVIRRRNRAVGMMLLESLIEGQNLIEEDEPLAAAPPAAGPPNTYNTELDVGFVSKPALNWYGEEYEAEKKQRKQKTIQKIKSTIEEGGGLQKLKKEVLGNIIREYHDQYLGPLLSDQIELVRFGNLWNQHIGSQSKKSKTLPSKEKMIALIGAFNLQ